MFRWFDTSLWQDPATGRSIPAQAPFTLRQFPTRFPDVRFSDLRSNFSASRISRSPTGYVSTCRLRKLQHYQHALVLDEAATT